MNTQSWRFNSSTGPFCNALIASRVVTCDKEGWSNNSYTTKLIAQPLTKLNGLQPSRFWRDTLVGYLEFGDLDIYGKMLKKTHQVGEWSNDLIHMIKTSIPSLQST